MTYALIDASYPEGSNKFSIAGSWIKWYLGQRGIKLVRPDRADFVLITAGTPTVAPTIRRRVKKCSGVRVLGGAGALSPVVFNDCADLICVGEGQRFLDTLIDRGLTAAAALPETWMPGDKRAVTPNEDFPWKTPPILLPDGKYRIFESRGCKHKCLFCQTGWSRRYAENPNLSNVRRAARTLERQGLRYDLVTNDAGVTGLALQLRGTEALSFSFRKLKTLPPANLPRTIRIGVEGVSERLRRAIGKPIPTGELVELCRKLRIAKKTVRLFFIVGLPLETDDDYGELRDLVRSLGRLVRAPVDLVFHAFIPEAAAPLAVFPLEDSYQDRVKSFWDDFFDGPYYSKGLNLTRPAGPPTRLKRAMLSMGASEVALRRGWWTNDNPNWRVCYRAGPDKMRKLAKAYENKLTRE